MATPLSIEHLDRVDSTQDEARARFAGQPLLITATGQDAGRGRTGAGWRDADRSLAASVALRPGWDADRLPVVTLVAGLAVLDVLGERVDLKWPNDVVLGDDKAGGILTEASDGTTIVGLGLNVAWDQPPAGMAALHGRDPGIDHVRVIAERWAQALLERIAIGPDAWGRDEYVARCATIGRSITWEPDGRGAAVGIDLDGALLVETDAGIVPIYSGAVREVRAD